MLDAVHFLPTNYGDDQLDDSCVAQNNQGGKLRNAIARVAFSFLFDVIGQTNFRIWSNLPD
jgi:hypothetical protein